MEDLLPYYKTELQFFRQMSAEFAAQYPKIAGRLQLDDGICPDPHVERFIEASALLAARVQKKIDDEFPEITESLLGLLCPHYLRPIPSMAIAQFGSGSSQSPVAPGSEIKAGTALHRRAGTGDVCTFRTCYPVTLWPLEVAAAELTSPDRVAVTLPREINSVLRLSIASLGGIPLAKTPFPSLRFYLDGDPLVTHTLYETLLVRCRSIIVRPLAGRGKGDGFTLDSAKLRPVGLEDTEGLLPYSDRSFLGYRLLQEYFHFPEKFLFLELAGLAQVARESFGEAFEILFCLNTTGHPEAPIRLEQGLTARNLQLGCTPVVNLFQRNAESVRLTHTSYEYRVVPDQHRQMTTEVYSVDEVHSTAAYSDTPQIYRPFYSFRHAYTSDTSGRFWHAHRRPSHRKGDPGAEMYLTLVDLSFRPATPDVEMLTVRVTCTNRDLPRALEWSLEWGELFAEDKSQARVRLLNKPTATVRPPARRGLQWRLISHLALNHLSIMDGGLPALQEILRLYDFHEGDTSPVTRKQIAGIVGLETKGSVSRVRTETGGAFCRGIDVIVDFDERQYAGSGVFLLASVLEKFFALYSAINSFTRMTARTSKGVLKRWDPLAGEQRIL